MPRIIVSNLMFEGGNQFGPLRTRTNQAHFTPENIPELWNLVDVPSSHESANFEASRIILTRPSRLSWGLRVEAHTADFNNIERLAVPSHSTLTIKDRTRRFLVDQAAKDRDDRNRHDEACHPPDNVHHPLDHAIRDMIERQSAYTHNRNAAT